MYFVNTLLLILSYFYLICIIKSMIIYASLFTGKSIAYLIEGHLCGVQQQHIHNVDRYVKSVVSWIGGRTRNN